MKRFALSLALALCLTLTAHSAAAPVKAVPLKVEGDGVVMVVKSFPVTVTATPGAHSYDWKYPDSVKAEEADNVLTITFAPKGTFKVSVRSTTIDFDKKTVKKDTGTVEVNVGDVPVPPGPDPKPPEPGPTPTPDVKPPIDAPGFRVLMIFDAAQKAKLTEAQKDVLEGREVYDFLVKNCAVDADNKQGAFRVWPSTVNTAGTSKPWADAMKRERKSHPWLIVSNGKTGYEGPLPNTSSEALELLKKYIPTANKKDGR